jgi:Ca2+/Na+ antiporter
MNKSPIFPSVMQATCPDFSMLVGKILGGLFLVQILVLVGVFLLKMKQKIESIARQNLDTIASIVTYNLLLLILCIVSLSTVFIHIVIGSC